MKAKRMQKAWKQHTRQAERGARKIRKRADGASWGHANAQGCTVLGRRTKMVAGQSLINISIWRCGFGKLTFGFVKCNPVTIHHKDGAKMARFASRQCIRRETQIIVQNDHAKYAGCTR